MILIHVQQYFASEEVQESALGSIIEFLGSIPAAPVFMFILGTGIVYSTRSTPHLLIKRGFVLIFAGYILNICRGTVPNLLQWSMDGDPGFLYLAAASTFYIDIFQFAGLSLIFFGCIKKLCLQDFWIAMITLGFSLLNYLVSSISISDPVGIIITGLFWGSGDISYFPFLSWIFYPVAGYFFGNMLIRSLDKTRFYTILLGSSLLVLMSLWFLFTVIFHIDTGLSSDSSYYHHGLLVNFLFTSFVIAWISVLFLLLKIIPNFLMKIFERWSRNVSEMYIVQWILIGWLVLLIGYNNLELSQFIVILALILILTDVLSQHFRVPL